MLSRIIKRIGLIALVFILVFPVEGPIRFLGTLMVSASIVLIVYCLVVKFGILNKHEP